MSSLVWINSIYIPCSVIQCVKVEARFARALRSMVAFDVFVVLRQGSFVCPIVCNEECGILTAYCLIAQYPPAHLCFSLPLFFLRTEMWVHLTKGTPLARSHYDRLHPLGLHTVTRWKEVEEGMTQQITPVLGRDRDDVVRDAIKDVTTK